MASESDRFAQPIEPAEIGISADADLKDHSVSLSNRRQIIQPEVAIQPKPVLDETPWQWFGAFSDDPTWGELFDEIERQRYGTME